MNLDKLWYNSCVYIVSVIAILESSNTRNELYGLSGELNMTSKEEFESKKLSLNNVEQLANIKANPVVKASIFSVITAVPIIGDLIDITIDAMLTDFQDKKRRELLEIILSDGERITSDMVNDVELILNFARILEAVNRLATNEKVKYFANLLKNGYFTEDKIKNYEFEEYFDTLNTMSYREIEILLLFYKYTSNRELNSQKDWQDNYLNEVKAQFDLENTEIISILNSLQRTGFLDKILDRGLWFSTESIKIDVWTTSYFEKFAKRIIAE